MKMKRNQLLLAVMALVAAAVFARTRDSANAGGPYIGQKAPGIIPEIFAPGIVSTGLHEANLTVSPDGIEIFWTDISTGTETIITTRLENGRWTPPEVVPFSGLYMDGFPAFHPDGTKLFFHSYRPLDRNSTVPEKVSNLWFIERGSRGWDEPRPVGPPVNGSGFVSGPSATKDGTLYFCRKSPNGGESVYRAPLVNGEYAEPERLPANVNCVKEIFHARVSPDESYLLVPVAGRADAIGQSCNYYVTFRDKEGRWSDLINLGATINNGRNGACASVSPDGKYIFFEAYPDFQWPDKHERKMTYADIKDFALSRPALYKPDIFWVDAKIIDNYRPEK